MDAFGEKYKMEFPKEFRPACRYAVQNGQPVNIEIIDQQLWGASGVVYARQHERKIVYIGRTDGRLIDRITDHFGYVSNPRGKKKPVEYQKWAEGKTITILAYEPPKVILLGYDVRVHRAIEAHLINEFWPPKGEPWFVTRA